MLISDFPFVRSVHLLGKRLFGALFPPYGWRPVDPGERNSSPREEPCTRREQLSPRREVSESIDRPIDRQSEAVERCAKTRRESERALAELLPNLPPPLISLRRTDLSSLSDHARTYIYSYSSRNSRYARVSVKRKPRTVLRNAVIF